LPASFWDTLRPYMTLSGCKGTHFLLIDKIFSEFFLKTTSIFLQFLIFVAQLFGENIKSEE
jgi:hypothetical protein